VVFVDDLDRCLRRPSSTPSKRSGCSLTPPDCLRHRTSRQVVESAIDSRYPTLRGEDGRGIGHDYLEKMLQLQVNLLALSAAKTDTYINLLISQLHLPAERLAEIVKQLRDLRISREVAWPRTMAPTVCRCPPRPMPSHRNCCATRRCQRGPEPARRIDAAVGITWVSSPAQAVASST
jgi:hypothetical protein